jgi:23S rRNA C2498 (ribose-2'-O)-methylase RlmM
MLSGMPHEGLPQPDLLIVVDTAGPLVEALANKQSSIQKKVVETCDGMTARQYDEFGRVMKGPQRQALGSSTPW